MPLVLVLDVDIDGFGLAFDDQHRGVVVRLRRRTFPDHDVRTRALVPVHGAALLIHLIERIAEIVPYKIHTVLTDNGIQFITPGAGGPAVPLIKEAIANGEIFRAHAFEYAGDRNDIEHRTTKARHPWTNGRVERMNRTIKDGPSQNASPQICSSKLRD